MLNPIELKLNLIAQGYLSQTDGLLWFQKLMPSDRDSVMSVLASICTQSHPQQADLNLAIELASLKPTFTPCVILSKAVAPEKCFGKIMQLPSAEQVKSFQLLLALFTIADTRRRTTSCQQGCQHAWHNLPSNIQLDFLRGTVKDFVRPFDSVAESDWNLAPEKQDLIK